MEIKRTKFKGLFFAFILIIGCFGLVNFSQAKNWEFKSWVSDITINEDSTFVVRETVAVNFQGSFSWLNRDIDLKRLAKISEVKVYDENNKALNTGEYEVSKQGNAVRVKINFVAQDEVKTWTIEYKVTGGLGYFKDHDELYWNAISSRRDVPIKKLELYVHLPQSLDKADLKQDLFVGATGASTHSTNFEIQKDGTMRYFGNEILPNTEFTIVAGWPKGVVKRDWWLAFSPYLWFLIPFAAFIVLFLKWWRNGRDPKMKETIIPQYEPPKGMTPYEVGILASEKSEVRYISATLIDLARRGYLKIVEVEKKEVFTNSKSYNFIRQKDFYNDPNLKEHEKIIMSDVFDNDRETSLDDLKNQFYREIPTIKDAVFQEITANNYFQRNPVKIVNKYKILGILILLIGGIGPLIYHGQILIFSNIAVGLTGILTIIFGHFMPVKTLKGAEAKWQILGFRMYLSIAERFRLQANVDPKTFEKFLAFAMVLGVEKKWAERFSDIYLESPNWYTGSNIGAGFILADFSNNLNSMTDSFSSTFASSPSSSSGFGGGGGAGGGGGGGGSSAG